MSRIRSAVVGAAALALGATMFVGAPASAANLCGYPPAPCGVPSNPVVPQIVGGGVVLVASSVAENTAPRTMANPPASNLGGAPKVSTRTGSSVSLVATGLAPQTTFSAKIKIDGKYVDLGTANTDAAGAAQLPVFRAAKPGQYTIALVNPATGKTSYIKVVVKPRR